MSSFPLDLEHVEGVWLCAPPASVGGCERSRTSNADKPISWYFIPLWTRQHRPYSFPFILVWGFPPQPRNYRHLYDWLFLPNKRLTRFWHDHNELTSHTNDHHGNTLVKALRTCQLNFCRMLCYTKTDKSHQNYSGTLECAFKQKMKLSILKDKAILLL